MVPDKRLLAAALGLAVAGAASALAAGCGSSPAPASSPGARGAPGAPLAVVAAENQYGNVAAQIGGRYVHVASVETDPSTDPHGYEVSPSVAREVSEAQLIIQNGLGYDDFMTRIEGATSGSGRKVIDVQRLLGLPNGTANPHLWYQPRTMPAVAQAVAADLAAADPAHAPYYQANLAAFDRSLQPWSDAISGFEARYSGTTAATTEPVADYLLSAMGVKVLTPFSFQADVMNGTDPAPQDIALENRLLQKRQVELFTYNDQVTDTLTVTIRSEAQKAGVPVVGVYETMPAGYTYQSWMVAETEAIQRAVVDHESTVRL